MNPPPPAPADAAPKVDAQQPWVGLYTFTEALKHYFKGREAEIDELDRRVDAGPLTVLYGISGLGKSSLICAGYFPLARERGFLPVHVRLDFSPGAAPLPRQVLAQVREQALKDGGEAPEPQHGDSLWQYFQRKTFEAWSPGNQLLTPLLVMDQFEEIFTRGGESETSREQVRQLILELSDLIEGRTPRKLAATTPEQAARMKDYRSGPAQVRVIFALREDFLPQLDSLRDWFPTLRTNTLRLLPLSGSQAMRVIQENGSQLVPDAVAEHLIEFVAASRRESRPEGALADGRSEAIDHERWLADYRPPWRAPTDPESRLDRLSVDPALLSIVLRDVNEARIEAKLPRITLHLAESTEGEVLENFYRDSFAVLPEAVRDRAKRFVEDVLLSDSGYRNQCTLIDASHFDDCLKPEIIEKLVSERRLLRYEERLGARRVEIAHDVLLPLIRDSKAGRRQQEAEAEKTRLTEEAAEKLRKTYRLAAAFLVLFIAASLFAWYGFAKKAEADEKKAEADEKKAEAVASQIEARNAYEEVKKQENQVKRERGMADLKTASFQWKAGQNSEALAAQMRALGSLQGEDLVTARCGALAHLIYGEWLVPLALHHQMPAEIRSAEIGLEGHVVLASADQVQVLDHQLRTVMQKTIGAGVVSAVATSSPWVAAAAKGSDLHLFRWTDQKDLVLPAQSELDIKFIRISPDGRHVLVAYREGSLRGTLWSPTAKGSKHEPLEGTLGELADADFTPDGRYLLLAAGSSVQVWDCASLQRVRADMSAVRHSGPISRVSACPRSAKAILPGDPGADKMIFFATGGQDGQALLAVFLDDDTKGAVSGRLPARGNSSEVTTLRWHPQGIGLAVGMNGGELSVIGLETALQEMTRSEEMQRDLRGIPTTSLRRRGEGTWAEQVVFSPHGSHVATYSSDGMLRVKVVPWRGLDEFEDPEASLRLSSRLVGLGYSPDGRILMAATQDGSVHLLNGLPSSARPGILAHDEDVSQMIYCPVEQRIVSIAGSKAQVWSAATWQSRMQVEVPQGCQAVLGCGEHCLITGSNSSTGLCVADLSKPLPMNHPLSPDAVERLAYSQEASLLLAANYDSLRLLRWNAKKQSLTRIAEEPLWRETIDSATLAANGTLCAASAGRKWRIWPVSAGTADKPVEDVEAARIDEVLVSPAGDSVAVSVNLAGYIRFGPREACLSGTDQKMHRFSFSPKMRQLMAFDQEGRHLALASLDQTVRVLDVASGMEAALPIFIDDTPKHLSFAEKLPWLVVSTGHRVQVWHWPSGLEITPPLIHRDDVKEARLILENGRLLVLTRSGRDVCVWPLHGLGGDPDARWLGQIAAAYSGLLYDPDRGASLSPVNDRFARMRTLESATHPDPDLVRWLLWPPQDWRARASAPSMPDNLNDYLRHLKGLNEDSARQELLQYGPDLSPR